jgi:hypothetical protein
MVAQIKLLEISSKESSFDWFAAVTSLFMAVKFHGLRASFDGIFDAVTSLFMAVKFHGLRASFDGIRTKLQKSKLP